MVTGQAWKLPKLDLFKVSPLTSIQIPWTDDATLESGPEKSSPGVNVTDMQIQRFRLTGNCSHLRLEGFGTGDRVKTRVERRASI
jgi:hypothetical protein